MATIGKTLFAHFRQVLHATAQYDQAITVFHRLKKRLEVSNLCSLSWDQTVTFSDLAHGLKRRDRAELQANVRHFELSRKRIAARMRTCQCMSHFVYNLRSRPLVRVRDLAARVRGQIASDHCRSDLITGLTHWARAGYPFPEVNLPEIKITTTTARQLEEEKIKLGTATIATTAAANMFSQWLANCCASVRGKRKIIHLDDGKVLLCQPATSLSSAS